MHAARMLKEIIILFFYLTAIGFTPDGSSTHLHINSIQNTEDGTYIITRNKKKIQGRK
jgi:hypothetical protein